MPIYKCKNCNQEVWRSKYIKVIEGKIRGCVFCGSEVEEHEEPDEAPAKTNVFVKKANKENPFLNKAKR